MSAKYYNDIILRLDKLLLAFEQTTLTITNKINNLHDKKICNDLMSIINQHHNEYRNVLLKEITDIYQSIKNRPLTPPPSYNEYESIQIKPIPIEPIQIEPSAPTYNQLINLNQPHYVPPITNYVQLPLEKQNHTRNLNKNIYTKTILESKSCKEKKEKCLIS